MNSTDQVHRALLRRVDDRNYVRISTDDLCLMTGLSRRTIQRALTQLVHAKLIRRRSKDGRSGGLLIRLETAPETAPETASKPRQNGAVVNDLDSKKTSVKGSLAIARGTAPSGASQQAESAWFVCCIWNDANGNLWCHGEDGYPTYIPCRSEAEAMHVAKQHRELLHKTDSKDFGCFPVVDICEHHGSGKRLHERLGEFPEGQGAW